MAIIIQKFGGTSVANIENIKKIAIIVKSEIDLGNKVIIIVSAMNNVTNNLISLYDSLPNDNLIEYDNILATGEQISSSLVSIALSRININAKSYLGWQLPIKTDTFHSNAKIIDIDIRKIMDSINADIIPVIAGFQGISLEGNITTLGRGGSDTSAVAIAAAVGAKRCDIYTDVDGVYNVDPNIIKSAKKFDKISYKQMLEMASLGAKVLQTRSVILAMNYKIPIRVLSSFSKNPGTLINDQVMENQNTISIIDKSNNIKFTINFESQNNANLFIKNLSDNNIIFDMLNYNINNKEVIISIVIEIEHYNKISKLIQNNSLKSKTDYNLSKISIIGIGIKNNTTVTDKIFNIMINNSVEILMFSISETNISILIEDIKKEMIIKLLYDTFCIGNNL